MKNSAFSDNDITAEFFKRYAGSPIFSFRGLLLWIFLLAYLFMCFGLQSNDAFGRLMMLGFCLFWFLLNAFQMHYFEVSDHFLVVKNHIFFWKKRIFKIADIEEIVFETQFRQANMLRVITEDLRRKRYRAGTLKDSTWLKLKKDLEQKSVTVRNECI